MNSVQYSTKDYPLDPFFNDTLDLFCIAGFDGFFKKVNPAASALLGFSEEELYSRSIKSFIHPSDQESTWAFRQNLINGKGFKNFENRYLTKNGNTIWLSWTSIPVENHDLVYAIAKDITQSKQREKERNRLITDLTQINKELKNITYTASHDLRTPVNNLMAVFSLLDTSTIHDEETKEFIDILKSATDQLKDTLNEYVDVLNEKNTHHAKIQTLNLKANLYEVLTSIQLLIDETDTEVEIHIPDNMSISFNKGKLKSIFLNLFTNAIKYAHTERRTKIQIKVYESEENIKLTFSDNGIGFDSENNADKVFGLNQSFHKNNDSKGVGLYLVYNHLKDMGGNISVESVINKGTKFTLTFRK